MGNCRIGGSPVFGSTISLRSLVSCIENSAGFAIMPLDWLDVEEARKLRFADPYDCLIAGTAIRLNMPLITRDHVIVDSKLSRWSGKALQECAFGVRKLACGSLLPRSPKFQTPATGQKAVGA
jgi:PIN domain